MIYYVWVDGSCDNYTNDKDEAEKWADEFALEDGTEDVYVTDEESNVVFVALTS